MFFFSLNQYYGKKHSFAQMYLFIGTFSQVSDLVHSLFLSTSVFFRGVKGIWHFDLIFHEWNKNCFLFIFIISNRIQFKWKIIRGMKQGSFLQKSTLCLIMIWRKLDTVEINCIIFCYTLKLKVYAIGLENNLMVINFQIHAENMVKRCI